MSKTVGKSSNKNIKKHKSDFEIFDQSFNLFSFSPVLFHSWPRSSVGRHGDSCTWRGSGPSSCSECFWVQSDGPDLRFFWFPGETFLPAVWAAELWFEWATWDVSGEILNLLWDIKDHFVTLLCCFLRGVRLWAQHWTQTSFRSLRSDRSNQ